MKETIINFIILVIILIISFILGIILGKKEKYFDLAISFLFLALMDFIFLSLWCINVIAYLVSKGL